MAGWIDRVMNKKAFEASIAKKLREIEIKMNKLVNGYLDGDFEKENYLIKKNELVLEKGDLKSKSSDLKYRTEKWLEPLRDWVKTAENMGVMTSSNPDLKELRDVIEKVGSKRQMRGGRIEFEFVQPYDLISKYRTLAKKIPQEELGDLGETCESSLLVARRAIQPTFLPTSTCLNTSKINTFLFLLSSCFPFFSQSLLLYCYFEKNVIIFVQTKENKK